MPEPEPPPPAEEVAESAPTARTARYCTRCGGPLAESTACGTCAVRFSRMAVRHEDARSPLRSALWLYFATLAVLVGGGIGFGLIYGQDSATPILIVDVLSSLVTIVACIMNWGRIRDGLARVSTPRWYAGAAGMSIITFGLASGVCWLIDHFTGMVGDGYSAAFEHDGYPFIVVVLSVCVQPAVFEELAFRGVILSSLQRVMENREAVLVSALMFAFLHLSVLSIVHLAIIGLALAYLRVRTGSLYPGMLMHFCHNFLVIVVERWG